VIWAFAVILFKKSGESVHPLALNTFKSTLATVLFIPTIFIFKESLFRTAPLNDYLLLFLSGALGIGIADSLFFMSLNRLGAGLSAIVDCLYSPFIIILSILFLGEHLTLFQVLGVVMIISAVLTATSTKGRGNVSRHNLIWGVIWGVLAMATMAVGIVIIKPLLNRSPLMWSTEIRLFGGILSLYVILLLHKDRRIIINSLFSIHSWKYTLFGSFLGAYVSMIFWVGGMKYAKASIAAALNQTSNIFVFIFAAIFLKEAINTQRTFAIIVAIAGALLVTFL
jgi:drug/metabolite transporter (DMT)-like permease